MVEIVINKLFTSKFGECLDYALDVFGHKTKKSWQEEYNAILRNLASNPEMYGIVHELGECPLYRGATIKKNFKIIFHYDENLNVVFIYDIWDMRQDPGKLIRLKRYYK